MRPSLRVAACALSLLAGACRADDLTDSAVRAFKAVDPKLQITVKDDNELEARHSDGSAGTIYLDNLRKTCRADPAGCGRATTDFAKHLVDSQGMARPVSKFTLDKLYPVLRQSGYAAQAAQLAKDPDKGLAVQAFGPDIELLFVLDSPNSIQYVSVGEQHTAGLADGALLAAAAGNAAHLPALQAVAVPRRDGLFALMYGDSLGSARLFDAALWNKIEHDIGGPVAVAVPTRDWILYTRLDDPAHVQDLRVVARNIASREAYAVSGDVFRRAGAGWTLVQGH